MRIWWLLILTLTGLLGGTADLRSADSSARTVYILPIREDITSSLVYVVRRGVKEAMEAKADLLVVDMDTNGGEGKAMEEIMDIINQFKGETVSFVNTKAFSAGALICFATHHIYMAPQSVIGAAAPVQASPEGGIAPLPDTVEVKVASAISALVRANAEKNGHNVEVADAMVKKTKELKMDGKVINEKGQILTLTNKEAEEKYGDPPTPLLSDGTVDSLDDLLAQLGFANARRTTIQASGMEKLGAWINAISPLLLIVGVVGLYLEIKMPGAIVPAAVAVIAFLLYFLGGYAAGLSGMEWILVFVIGLALVLSELFLHPGTIIPGVIGFILIFIALVMAMVDMYPGMPMLPSLPQLTLPVRNITTALVGSVAITLILARFLPKTPLFRALISQSASGVTSVLEQEQQQASRVGQTGVAISNLRPGGKAQFADQILDVITQGEMIPKGQTVRIIRHSGGEAVVESVN